MTIMSHTKEFLASEEPFRSTLSIFHGPLNLSTGEEQQVAGARTFDQRLEGEYRTHINPVTFDSTSKTFFADDVKPSKEVTPPTSAAAWYKAYKTEASDEFQDPRVCPLDNKHSTYLQT